MPVILAKVFNSSVDAFKKFPTLLKHETLLTFYKPINKENRKTSNKRLILPGCGKHPDSDVNVCVISLIMIRNRKNDSAVKNIPTYLVCKSSSSYCGEIQAFGCLKLINDCQCIKRSWKTNIWQDYSDY